LAKVAEARGASPAQVAIGWALSRGADIVPLVGARTRDRLTEALGAAELSLSDDDLAAVEQAVRRARRPATATTHTRWPRWTASADDLVGEFNRTGL